MLFIFLFTFILSTTDNEKHAISISSNEAYLNFKLKIVSTILRPVILYIKIYSRLCVRVCVCVSVCKSPQSLLNAGAQTVEKDAKKREKIP